MPQLDTIYMFMVFQWTWFMLYLLTQESSATLMTTKLKMLQNKKYNKETLTLPWT